MSDTSRVRVYMACSLDGFIAGPDDDLSWLEPSGPPPDTPEPTGALAFDTIMAQVGALLMGRRTHDVVAELGVWAAAQTVRAVTGDIGDLVAQAKDAAGGKDVYLDGGTLIRQALDAGLVDEMVLTFVPILLAGGTRLFDGLVTRRSLVFVEHHTYGQMLQVTARIRPEETST